MNKKKIISDHYKAMGLKSWEVQREKKTSEFFSEMQKKSAGARKRNKS